uniref:Uncharacterized protein n=1 Tax=Ixodes ricinus TaxID=34613 RepID=A0A147BU34_IXORI
MVGVDANLLLLGREGVLAALQGFQLVVALQVGPPPHPAVDDVRQALAVRHLQPAVEGAGDGDALGRLAGAREGLLEVLDGPLALLQLLDERVHRLLGPFLLLIPLLPAQQLLHRGAREREEAVQRGHGVLQLVKGAATRSTAAVAIAHHALNA